MIKIRKNSLYIAYLAKLFIALTTTGISADTPHLSINPDSFQREDISCASREQLTNEAFIKQLLTLSLQNNGQAQYELFKIFRDGTSGRGSNPIQAINFGLKARNRPDPVPDILVELPEYISQTYRKLKSQNDPAAQKYLFLAMNLKISEVECIERCFEDASVTAGSDVPTHNSKEDISKVSDYILGEYIIDTQDLPADIENEVILFLKEMYSPIDREHPRSDPINRTLNRLKKCRFSMKTVCAHQVYPYLLISQALLLWRSPEILYSYLQIFRTSEEIALLNSFCIKMGVEGWHLDKSVQEIYQNIKTIELACCRKLREEYYLPAMLEQVDKEIPRNLQTAFELYCTVAKFTANNKVGAGLMKHLIAQAVTEEEVLDYRSKMLTISKILSRFITSSHSSLRLAGYQGYLPWAVNASDEPIQVQEVQTFIDAALKEFPTNTLILANAGSFLCYRLLDPRGLELLKRAAEQSNHSHNFILLGTIYLNVGHHFIETPEHEALKWYQLAAATGHPFALKLLHNLEALLRASQEKGALRQDHSDWLPKTPSSKKNKAKAKPVSWKKKGLSNRLSNQTPVITLMEPSDEMVQDLQKQLAQHAPSEPERKLEIIERPQEVPPQEPDLLSLSVESDTNYKGDEYLPLQLQHNKNRVRNPKTLRAQRLLRRMTMLSHLIHIENHSHKEEEVNLTADQKLTLKKIFDLTKPVITETEFLQLATASCFDNKFRLFKTTSGFALTAINGLIADQEERSAGTHWLHGSKRDGLDWKFVAKVRKVLDHLNIRPNLI